MSAEVLYYFDKFKAIIKHYSNDRYCYFQIFKYLPCDIHNTLICTCEKRKIKEKREFVIEVININVEYYSLFFNFNIRNILEHSIDSSSDVSNSSNIPQV